MIHSDIICHLKNNVSEKITFSCTVVVEVFTRYVMGLSSSKSITFS